MGPAAPSFLAHTFIKHLLCVLCMRPCRRSCEQTETDPAPAPRSHSLMWKPCCSSDHRGKWKGTARLVPTGLQLPCSGHWGMEVGSGWRVCGRVRCEQDWVLRGLRAGTGLSKKDGTEDGAPVSGTVRGGDSKAQGRGGGMGQSHQKEDPPPAPSPRLGVTGKDSRMVAPRNH